MSAYLKEVLENLTSDKPKEREQAIADIRIAFTRDNAVRKFDDVGDGRVWLAVFQALFAAVLQNKTVCAKKGIDKAQPISVRRLADSATTVRWLAERSVSRLNKRVVKPLMNHLLQTMVHQGQLLAPVALSYLKAIHLVLSYPPHLDHMDNSVWVDILTLCFAVLLGDSLRAQNEFDEDIEMHSDHEGNVNAEDDGDDDDEDMGDITPPAKKRRRDANSPRKASSKSNPTPGFTTISPEQIECVRVILLLLRSPAAPFLSPAYPGLSRSILAKLRRFFISYPPDTSAHQDAVSSVNAILSQIEMNARNDVTDFGAKMWDPLVSLWATKNKTMKEGILISLRTLFPLIIREDSEVNMGDGFQKLLKLWDIENKFGLECLPLDVLRLEHDPKPQRSSRAFESATFQSGFQFGFTHALSWAALELLADCSAHLYILSESVHSGTPSRGGKRRRVENPFNALLQRNSPTTTIRVYHLQVLLFSIDRHWLRLDSSLQSNILNHLLSMSHTDPVVESWIFLCLSAIAVKPPPEDIFDWEPVWKHALRRTSNPGVCRAAAHAANLLLLHAKLAPQRILGDIESFAQDLVVQGPSFPYDSVCMLLCSSLRVAGQDARLYRLHLEESVLSWLSETWSVVDGTTKGFTVRTRVEPHLVRDVLALLESICGLSKRYNIVCNITNPDCDVAYTMTEQRKTAVIRDFLLSAHVPPLQTSLVSADMSPKPSDQPPAETSPRGRERKTSAFLLKCLEALASQWESAKTISDFATAEKVRRTLDVIALSLSFEATLEVNGIKSNKKSIQSATRLLSMVTPCILMPRWSTEERALVLMGLEPLVRLDVTMEEDTWEAMPSPSVGTGIRRNIIAQLTSGPDKALVKLRAGRRSLLLKLWSSAEMQEASIAVLDALKEILKTIGCQPGDPDKSSKGGENDDDFAPIRSTPVDSTSQTTILATDKINSANASTSMCFTFISVAGMLRGQSFEPVRQKTIAEMLLHCDGDSFLSLAPDFFRAVRERALHFGFTSMESFLQKFSDLLQAYAYSRSPALHLLAIDFLDSTSSVWTDKSQRTTNVGDQVRELYQWFAKMLSEQKIKSWKIRDRLVRFMDLCLQLDPLEEIWRSGEDPVSIEYWPSSLLSVMAADEDIRVRFRVAVALTRLFLRAPVVNQSPIDLYIKVQKSFTTSELDVERMVTRLLSLANIMIVSSAVRRGPYWNLIEICLHTSIYSRHIDALLRAVAERMGLSEFSHLFESYASQIAFSTHRASSDFSCIPASHLGYRDRRECAERSFPLICPTLILAQTASAQNPAHGEKMFLNQCTAAHKDPTEGLRECFADIIGLRVTLFMDDTPTLTHENSEKLYSQVLDQTVRCNWEGDPDAVLKAHIDRIVVAILVMSVDTEHSPGGTISKALEDECGPDANRTFQSLMLYRREEDFKMHSPNLPGASTSAVLRSLSWLTARIPAVKEPSTSYHVTQQLFARVGLSPLVNEQIRLLQAICIWVAINHRQFRDPTLLRTLMKGAAIILAQSDLARIAQSILTWTFCRYREPTNNFPEIFGRIGRISSDHLSNVDDPFSGTLGEELMDWVEKQATNLCRTSSIQSQILTALPLWPREPAGDLASLAAEELLPERLSKILGDTYLTSGKFRIVRRLREAAETSSYDPTTFAQTDFWLLKACIPSNEHLQFEDIEAFIALLTQNYGQIQAISTEGSERTVASIHRRLALKKPADFRQNLQQLSPKSAIIMSLFEMTSSDRVRTFYVAYRALRPLLSILANNLGERTKWPSDVRQEMDFLRSCPLPMVQRPVRTLEDLQNPSVFLDTTANFTRWISALSLLLSDYLSLQDPFYAQLAPVLQSEVDFASQMLPILVHEILLSDAGSPKDTARVILSQYFKDLLSYKDAAIDCIRSVIQVVLHLRHFIPPSPSDPLAADRWLDLSYILLSRGAIMCGAYTTALLFLEVAVDLQPADFSASTIEDILYDIYRHIEEPDGFYGIKSQDVRRFLVRRFHHEKQWDKAFQFHGANYETDSGQGEGEHGILTSLHSFGFNRLAMNVLQSSNPDQAGNSTDLVNMGYHLGWRTETWDLPDNLSRPGATLYSALRSVHRERDPAIVDQVLQDTTFREVERLRVLGNENMIQIRNATQTLMCLGEIQKWRRPHTQLKLSSRVVDLDAWSSFTTLSPDFDFQDFESVVATRLSLIRSVKQREQREQVGIMQTNFLRGLVEIEKQCLVQLASAAQEAGHPQVALNSVLLAQQLDATPSFAVSQEFASVLWLQKEQKMAVEYLRNIVTTDARELSDSVRSQRAVLLARLGGWVAEACLQKPPEIRKEYFEPAIKLLGENGHRDQAHGWVYHQTAIFAEHQYTAILRSPEVARLKVYVERKREELSQIKNTLESLPSVQQKKANELTQHQRKAQALYEQDSFQYSTHTETRDSFLKQAIEMYTRCLMTCDSYDDDAVIRLCSLWFANFENDASMLTVQSAISNIPSHKFLFLAHQLSARLTQDENGSQSALQALVLRMCRDHPFHILYQVYALRQGVTSRDISQRQSSRHVPESSSQTGRSEAAAAIFQKLRESSCKDRVRDIERVCDAALEWAKFPIKNNPSFVQAKKGPGPHPIPPNLLLMTLKDVKVPVPTRNTTIDPTREYEDIVYIKQYANKFTLAGGVNLPKISTCTGSDGRGYKQLFKGEGGDDLRQDAVMEQVFELVNIVLQRDRETKKRQLCIRSYKVIPLAAQAGVLEFVQNTQPLMEWLSEAHARHYPQDWSHTQCHHQLKRKRKEKSQGRELEESLLRTFILIRENFHPVFRHYFRERHKLPMAWFAMRLRYARSVATCSIVGHILGLGDRHVSNILIDQESGEMIHIDLGIAFDQGKLLPIPETVPFRLTADMVDGLGVSGTEGVFRRCAEETLRVLRNGSEVIKTVLEVFRHDPLHSWTASAIKIQRVQSTAEQPVIADTELRIGMGSDLVDESADRAINSVTRKLDQSLSVEYTVNDLISEATDPRNLSLIFSGWNPHL